MAYNTIPSIKIQDVPLTDKVKYGYNERLCVIGAFSLTTSQIQVCKSADEAKALFGDDAEYHDKYFDMLFSKNNEILIYNVNYGRTDTIPKVITAADIASAQAALYYDNFDLLLPLGSIHLMGTSGINPLLVALQTMHDDYYNNKDKPFGIIAGIELDEATVANLNSFRELFKEHGMYKAICTPLSINNTNYGVAMAAVYNAIVTLNKPVKESETMMIYDNDIDGKVTSDILTDLTIQNLIDAGFHTTQYFDRGTKTVQCISNITPSKYDMRIERSFNYIIGRINFAKALGMDNNRISYDVLDSIIKYEKTTAIKSGICTDMIYEIRKTGIDEVTIDLTVVFNDIIRTIQANVNLVVE